MSPTFTPIRLTIIDFLGVFLPGMVWTVLFFTLREMVSPQWNIKPTDPLKVAFFIATLPKELSGHATWLYLHIQQNGFLFEFLVL
ncbi:MAG: hypothetical protein GPJ35_18345 [Microcystis aeruginosa G11-09]|nr:hypothetical protein [Microcystis aeruginosa G11-09]